MTLRSDMARCLKAAAAQQQQLKARLWEGLEATTRQMVLQYWPAIEVNGATAEAAAIRAELGRLGLTDGFMYYLGTPPLAQELARLTALPTPATAAERTQMRRAELEVLIDRLDCRDEMMGDPS